MDMQISNRAGPHTPPLGTECDGVDYSPKHAAGRCPRCGAWVKAYNREPWMGALRIRHHRCACGRSFKSIQQDPVA